MFVEVAVDSIAAAVASTARANRIIVVCGGRNIAFRE